MRLPVFSHSESESAARFAKSAGGLGGLRLQGDPCPGYKHQMCNIRAGGCLFTLPLGPAAFGTCLANAGTSDCFPCWFPHL